MEGFGIEKAYVKTKAGQVHYRTCGPEEGMPLLLLHWAPGTGRMYEPVLPLFAAKGYEVFALDILGFGRSDPRPDEWQIADFADNVIEAMVGLGLGSAFVLGGHFSGAVVCEMALRSPEVVRKLVLDGSPCWDAETREKVLASLGKGPPQWAPDAGLEAMAWERAVFALKEWDSSFEVTQESLPKVWAMMIDYLEMGFQAPAGAIGQYDMAARMPGLTVPVLALSADEESLRPQHETVMRLVPHCQEHVFKGQHPVLYEERAAGYVGVVDTFLLQ